jgi:hypothetical protein
MSTKENLVVQRKISCPCQEPNPPIILPQLPPWFKDHNYLNTHHIPLFSLAEYESQVLSHQEWTFSTNISLAFTTQ